MKKFISFMLVLYLFIPVSVFAYSDYVMASGKNIGIELKSDYVLVVGSYDINNHNILYESELQIGDKIKEVNGISVNSAYELNEAINKIKTILNFCYLLQKILFFVFVCVNIHIFSQIKLFNLIVNRL